MNKRQVWVIKLHASYPFMATVVECRMGEIASCRILRFGSQKTTDQVKKHQGFRYKDMCFVLHNQSNFCQNHHFDYCTFGLYF